VNVGGLPVNIDFDEDRCMSHKSAVQCGYMSNLINLDYVSRLVATSYVRDEAHTKAVLDALTPFQLASKMWAANALRILVDQRSNRGPIGRILYVGAWFGMQHAIANFYLQSEHKAVLMDKDKESLRVARLCYDASGITNYDTVVMDVKDYNWTTMESNSIVVWTGCEHFADSEIERAVNEADNDTRWLFQGTNMEGEGHINPISHPAELAKYFHDEPIYTGTMTTPVGKRFQVAF
jgi:hypothetical protein